MNFDSIFFIGFGAFCLVMGLLNKGRSFWSTFKYDGLKKSLGSNYNRVINISMGIISIIIGIYLLKKNS